MKQKLFLLLALLAMTTGARAQTYTDVLIGYLKYKLAADTAIVTGYLQNFMPEDSTVVVPETVEYNGNSYRVTTIGYRAFGGCRIPKLTLAKSVKRLEEYAINGGFVGDIDLTGVDYIGSHQFMSAGWGNFHIKNYFRVKIRMDVKYVDTEAFMFDYNQPQSGHLILIVEDADTIYEQGCFEGTVRQRGDMFASQFYHHYARGSSELNQSRMIVPMGKARLILEKWHLQTHHSLEIYSPVPRINKSKDGLGTMVITEDNPASSFTFNGVKYENSYDFNFALNKDRCFWENGWIWEVENYYDTTSEKLDDYISPLNRQLLDDDPFKDTRNHGIGRYRAFYPTDKTVGLNQDFKVQDLVILRKIFNPIPAGLDSYLTGWYTPCNWQRYVGMKTGQPFMLFGPAADTIYAPLAWDDNRQEVLDLRENSFSGNEELLALQEKERLCREHGTWVPDPELMERFEPHPDYPPLTTAERQRMNALNTELSNWSGYNNYYYLPERTIHLREYTGPNYLRAGTGAAVPRESEEDGVLYRNFYYTNPSGFWECNNTVIPKNRAYLALPASIVSNIKSLGFVIEDGYDIGQVTGLIHLDMDENDTLAPNRAANDAWYTLSGVKLTAKPTEKGIYIHNGKKEVIR